ncbi:MAG: ATP-dependent Clp protease adaptor protein ClpS [Thermoleophilia bacterium]|nr:ATP-dependent Clp protease adaptor protein ClpS [Thermoleophilia bacterium]
MMGDIEVIERPHVAGPGSGSGGGASVVVLNDDHNTFEGVASALSRVLPGVDFAAGIGFANRIHAEGRACVWQGELEVAELYWQQLRDSGLTMAPIERG